MKEEWKPIVGYEGLYEISNKNRVKSLRRFVVGGRYNCKRELKEKILKDRRGDVSLSKNKCVKTLDVYTLKQMHFNGFKPDGSRKKVIKNNKVITRRELNQSIKANKKGKTSQYTGVSYSNLCKKWRAAININNKDIHLGVFEKELDAKIIYEKALINMHLYKGIPKLFRKMLNDVFLNKQDLKI